MAVFSVRSSLYATLDAALDYFHYDISIGFTQSYRADRIVQEALRVPGVQAVEVWGFTSGRILKDDRKESEDAASQNAFLLAPPPDTAMIQPQMIAGRWLLTADAGALVINTEVLKNNPHLAVGKPAVIKVGTRKLRGTVVGIMQSTMNGPLIYAPYAWLGRSVQDAGRARSVQIVSQSRDPQVQATLGRTLEEHLKQHNLRIQNVEIIWQQKQRIKAQFDILTNFLLIMSVLLAVVGALGLTGTMGINVLERTREIGVMRAIGASSVDIAKVLIVEALCMGWLSWLIGLMIALPVAAILSYQVGMLFLQAPLTFSFSFLGVAIWLVLVVVLAVGASLLPAANAARLSVRDVLNYE
jgi:putative ABC transport system permease protein